MAPFKMVHTEEINEINDSYERKFRDAKISDNSHLPSLYIMKNSAETGFRTIHRLENVERIRQRFPTVVVP